MHRRHGPGDHRGAAEEKIPSAREYLREECPISEIDRLLEQIENQVISSIKIPFTSKTILDEDKLIDLLDVLRQNLPVQIQQAEQIVSQSDAIVLEAQRKAEALIVSAEQQAGQIVSESEIVQQARLEAERLRQEVNEELRQQQSQADRYSEEVLCDLEAKISRTLTTIQNGRSQLSGN